MEFISAKFASVISLAHLFVNETKQNRRPNKAKNNVSRLGTFVYSTLLFNLLFFSIKFKTVIVFKKITFLCVFFCNPIRNPKCGLMYPVSEYFIYKKN